MKLCSRCNKEKEESEFHKARNAKDGLYSYCKDCANAKRRSIYNSNFNKERIRRKELYHASRDKNIERSRDYRRNNPNKIRASGLKSRYGISPEQYDKQLLIQGGLCAICQVDIIGYYPSGKLKAHLDHCHKTKEIRGLLCTNCNTGLGHLGDDENGLLKALNYLRNPPFRKNPPRKYLTDP